MTNHRQERAQQIAEQLQRLVNSGAIPPEGRIDLGIVPPNSPIAMVNPAPKSNSGNSSKNNDRKK